MCSFSASADPPQDPGTDPVCTQKSRPAQMSRFTCFKIITANVNIFTQEIHREFEEYKSGGLKPHPLQITREPHMEPPFKKGSTSDHYLMIQSVYFSY